ncbi:AAA family ATPase [Dysgonomonas sp. 511]|uniref:AAA family ATPase n=1 Tax=Dysgonomonas sp. 511 TaxID=2302930 RepID=UPI0013CF6EE6|nr:AAA family ATPase [Dysgonomonas sp. 511]NDV78323.1 ATP-binding protein [Dysgonomonas sp. 511]
MILRAIKYTRHISQPRQWQLDGPGGDYAYFENINLLVGKNSAGKTRTLSAIHSLANLLKHGKEHGRDVTVGFSENFDVIFTDNGKHYNYILSLKNGEVTDEVIKYEGKTLLDRNKNFLLDSSGKQIAYEVETSKPIAASFDKDGKPYFELFVEWGNSLMNYMFANQFEKSKQVLDYTRIDGGDPGIESTEILIYTFYSGGETYGDAFKDDIIAGMNDLGYNITDVSIHKNEDNTYGLCVEEDGSYIVSQRDMSQGLFRSLAMIIMLSYARMSNMSLCMLVDDMGEGLDFDASRRMMNIVIKRINNSNLQFFITTNDRYVMNQIPLRYWTVIERETSARSVFYDYTNSKDKFEDFKYTGLNNFEFLTTDFFKEGFGAMEEDDE